MHSVSDDVRYRLLKLLADQPSATQRELARELGISLGKINYCLKALMEKGWVKVRNFTNSQQKTGYAYMLTARGKCRSTTCWPKRLRCSPPKSKS